MICITRIIKRNSDLPVHVVPVHPVAHVHVNVEPEPTAHMPLFLQGLGWHGLGTLAKIQLYKLTQVVYNPILQHLERLVKY